MCLCVGSICALWLPPLQSKEMHTRLIGVSELTIGVNVSVSVSVCYPCDRYGLYPPSHPMITG